MKKNKTTKKTLTNDPDVEALIFDDKGQIRAAHKTISERNIKRVVIEQARSTLEDTVRVENYVDKVRSSGELMGSKLVASSFMRIQEGDRRMSSYDLPINTLEDFEKVRARIGLSKRNAVALAMDIFVSLYEGYDV